MIYMIDMSNISTYRSSQRGIPSCLFLSRLLPKKVIPNRGLFPIVWSAIGSESQSPGLGYLSSVQPIILYPILTLTSPTLLESIWLTPAITPSLSPLGLTPEFLHPPTIPLLIFVFNFVHVLRRE